jgi:DNA adenine methylase
MQAITEIKRPALRYYGGKWKLAPWIISHFPEHRNYVEPCGGAASVLLQKPRSELETFNDINKNIVNFFAVLRDNPGELIRRINLTPWARAEYELSIIPADDIIEQARRTAIALWMSISAGEPTGWRVDKDSRKRFGKPVCFDILEHNLEICAERFRGVQIENRDAIDIIRRFDTDETLIYFDPPYMLDTRTCKNGYKYEVDHEFHVQAAVLLRQAHGFVIISGYQHPLYSELYEMFGWERIDKEVQTNSGGKRVESLWLSPKILEWRQNNRLHLTGKGGGQIQLFNSELHCAAFSGK